MSEDDEHDWVMGTISNTLQLRMESFRQKQINLEELMQPGWGDAAEYVCERDMKYRIAQLNVPAVVKSLMVTIAAIPAPTTCGEPFETLNSIPG